LSVWIVVLGLFASATASVSFEADPVLGWNPSTGTYTYQSFIGAWNSHINAGENAWNTLDLNRNFSRVTTSNRQVYVGSIDGVGNRIAEATWTCLAETSSCFLRFDIAENWYAGSGSPGPGQLDVRGVSAHEFGHWHGLGHSNFNPTSDSGLNTMGNASGVAARTIEQDDVNGFWRTASDTVRMASNKSFEFGNSLATHWEFRQASPPGSGGGTHQLVHNSSATPWGNDYVRLQNSCGACGNNISVRQNIEQRKSFSSLPQPAGAMTAQAHLRGPTGNTQALLVVWIWTGVWTPLVKSCTATTSWNSCTFPNLFVANSQGTFTVYLEVYNTDPSKPLYVDMVDLYL